MSFPTIFCGKNRAENTEREVNVSYGEICKCRQKSCQSYSQYLKLQTKSILDKMNICLRKTKKTPKNQKIYRLVI